MNLYTNKSSHPKWNAQENLAGRTHYVDDDTLKFHYARVLSTLIPSHGLLFGLTESVALDMHNTQRGFRHVIFDIFGTVLGRLNLDDCWKTHAPARTALRQAIYALDEQAITREGIKNYREYCEQEMQQLEQTLETLQRKAS